MVEPADHTHRIADLYDAALDPRGLDAVCAILARAAQGTSAMVAVLGRQGPIEAAAHGQPDAALSQYGEYYRLVNPLAPLVSALGPMQVRRQADLMDVLAYRDSEFYTDFARHCESQELMGTSAIPIGPGLVGHVGIHRARRPFGDGDERALQVLVPHLQRALQIRLRLGLGAQGDLGLAALDALAVACIVCNGAGLVAYANRAAEQLERDGVLTLGAGGIGAPDPRENGLVLALVGRAAQGRAGGAATIGAGAGQTAFVLTAPLPRGLGGGRGLALVMVRRADAAPSFDASMLRALFALTAAEARLAMSLAQGATLAEVASAQGLSENTLRSQLAAVLRKTGSATQRDLVRLLGHLPPLALRAESR